MGRRADPKPDYVNNFIGLQKNYRTDTIIFCSLNRSTDVLTVCGWIEKGELPKKTAFFPKGTRRYRDDGTCFVTKADLFEIRNTELSSPCSFDELCSDLKKLKRNKP